MSIKDASGTLEIIKECHDYGWIDFPGQCLSCVPYSFRLYPLIILAIVALALFI